MLGKIVKLGTFYHPMLIGFETHSTVEKSKNLSTNVTVENKLITFYYCRK